MKMKYILIFTMLLSASVSHAALISLDDIDGVRIQDSDLDGTGDAVQRSQLWAGNVATDDWGVLFVYELPTLGVDEQTITSADFSALQNSGVGSPDLLVSVFTRSNLTVQAADYQGAGTDYTSSIVDLETGFGGANTTHTLTSGGQDALISFLNTNKDDNYLYIRIRANGAPVENKAYQYGVTATGSLQTAAATTLSFTAVPEPETFALLGGLFALGHVMVRRRG